MKITSEQFEQLVADAWDKLSDDLKQRTNNVAILIDNIPTAEQLHKLNMKRGFLLFGLFEGHCQARRLNMGPVLPDRITLFRQAFSQSCSSHEELEEQILNTLKHEIAHHLGSDETGARKASQKD